MPTRRRRIRGRARRQGGEPRLHLLRRGQDGRPIAHGDDQIGVPGRCAVTGERGTDAHDAEDDRTNSHSPLRFVSMSNARGAPSTTHWYVELPSQSARPRGRSQPTGRRAELAGRRTPCGWLRLRIRVASDLTPVSAQRTGVTLRRFIYEAASSRAAEERALYASPPRWATSGDSQGGRRITGEREKWQRPLGVRRWPPSTSPRAEATPTRTTRSNAGRMRVLPLRRCGSRSALPPCAALRHK